MQSYTSHTRPPSNLRHYTQGLQAYLYITHKTSKQSSTLHTRLPSNLIHYTHDLNLIHYTQDLQAFLYITHKPSTHSYTLHKTSKILYTTQTSMQSYTLHTRSLIIPLHTNLPRILIHCTQDIQATLYIKHTTSN